MYHQLKHNKMKRKTIIATYAMIITCCFFISIAKAPDSPSILKL